LEERGVAQDSTEISFLEYIKRFDQAELKAYFDMLKRILDHLKVEIGDQRLVFNFYNNGLQFTIGQRYSLVYFPNRKDAKFFVAAKKSLGNLGIDKLFSGPPQTYLCRRNEIDLDDSEFASVIEALTSELSENSKSRYRKWNKVDFENYIFSYSGILASTENEKGSLLFSLIESFTKDSANQNLNFSLYLTKRYIASLGTKPFVIFTGLSGSGKTKLAQTFAKWICESEKQYKIIPVGADWTNREPLLGYPNSLDANTYVLPDNGALDLILAAIENAEGKELKDCKPYFLILDEMNLSHVERYFADFLSGMESKEAISLYTGNERKDENGRAIPKEIKLPPNLFMVGTVNIDETTYMFSPKVLDRANTIEFRVDKNELEAFFDAPNEEPTSAIDATGLVYSKGFMEFIAQETVSTNNYQIQLLGFFAALQPIGAEFGYRTANEMNRLMALLKMIGLEKSEHALDVAVMQKLLPKLHGSRTKLSKVLPVLASFCFEGCNTEQAKTLLDEVKREGQLISSNKPTLPLSFAKIARMYATAQENGFASYAEG
jgi:hypothetical protein